MGEREKQKTTIKPEKVLDTLLKSNFSIVSTHPRTCPQDFHGRRNWLKHTAGFVTLAGPQKNYPDSSSTIFISRQPLSVKALQAITLRTGISFYKDHNSL